MKIIRTERGKGKTTALIKQASRDQSYILCVNKPMARYVYEKARDMGLNIPFPITVADLPLHGHENPILIDEIDYILPQLIGVKVDTVTTSAPIDTLGQKDDIKIELKLEIENIDEVKQQIVKLQKELNNLKVSVCL